jgi:hypothetical protein
MAGLMQMLDPSMLAYLRSTPQPTATQALGGDPRQMVVPMPPARPRDMGQDMPARRTPHSLDRINAIHRRQTQVLGGEVPADAYNAMGGGGGVPMPPPRPQGLIAALSGAEEAPEPAPQSGGILGMLGGAMRPPGGMIGDNRNALSMLGLGLMSERGGAGAMRGFMQGAQVDAQGRETRRTEAQAQAQQQQLAQMLQQRGLDPAMAQFPELAMQYLQPQAAGYETLSPEQTAALGLPEGTIAQRSADGKISVVNGRGQTINVGTQAAEREALATRMGLDPNSPEGRAYVLTGRLPNANNDRRASATELRALYAAEDELPALQGTIETLNQALELNQRALDGFGASTQGALGSRLPDALVPGSKEDAVATREFERIMDLEALKAMSATLTGATTNFELAEFQRILSDTSTPRDVRERTIRRMLDLAQRQQDVLMGRVEELRAGTAGRQGPPAAEDDAPAGVDPAVWEFMTPEERSLFQ